MTELPEHKPLERMPSKPKLVKKEALNFPTKKLRMRSLLWIKPTGLAESSKSSLLAQLIPTLIVNLAAVSSGLGFGFSAIAAPQLLYGSVSIHDDYHSFNINQDSVSWIGGMFGLGAIVGGFGSAVLGSNVGRRKCLLYLTIPDILGWIIIAASHDFYSLLVGRFLTGFSAAGYIPSILIYVAEISQPQFRGLLTAITIPAISIGTLLVYCLGYAISWYFVAAVSISIPLLLIPGLLAIPNSPYWYLENGKEKEAVNAMQKFRSKKANGFSELLAIADIMRNDDNGQRGWKVKEILQRLAGRKHRKPFIILNILFLLMVFSGNFAISFYAIDILKNTIGLEDAHMNEHVAAMTIGAIKVVAAVILLPAVQFCPRKMLLTWSSLIMAVSLGVLGVAMHTAHHQTPFPDWVPLTCLTTFMAADTVGLGSLPYIYISEFFPAHMRSLLGGVTIALSQIEVFMVVLSFPAISVLLGEDGVFWVFAGVCFVASIFSMLFVPETKGKTLEEIEAAFARKESLHVTPYSTPGPRRRANTIQSDGHPLQSIQFTL